MTSEDGKRGTTPRPVFLMTDFGAGSPYVGIMKAVIVSRGVQGIPVFDLCHDLPAFAIEAAAHVLGSAFSFLPQTAILAAVIDPGVGTGRGVLAFRAGERTVLAPDNGLLTPLLLAHPEGLLVAVARRDLFLPTLSATFHGRDIIAPLAAGLASGLREEDLGAPAEAPVRLPDYWERDEGSRIHGRVVDIDRFGNLITNIRGSILGPSSAGVRVLIGNTVIAALAKTYGAVAEGTLLAYVGSANTVEIARREGRADEQLGARRGDPVVIERSGGSR